MAIHGYTRIHLDTVRDLGELVEVETVADGLGDGLATAALERIVALLGLNAYETIAGSYADLVPPADERRAMTRQGRDDGSDGWAPATTHLPAQSETSSCRPP